jgi:two pore calcium channel protein 1
MLQLLGNGVRRVLRQIAHSVPAVLDIMVLLLFFVAIFAVMGFYIFANVDRSFNTLDNSFVSLFITLTTASRSYCPC